ncbi:MAG: DUF2666 family protein [Candidatus Anstonellaceae archaeon]
MEDEKGEIVFTAKYKDWIVIKKMSIDSKTKPEEVAAILASIEATLSRKSYQFSGIKQEQIEALAAKLVKGKRKSFASLAEVFSSLRPSEFKEQLLSSCPTEKHLQIAENYLVKTVLDMLGFKTNLDPETLQEVYPELKIPKPKGNFGKKS